MVLGLRGVLVSQVLRVQTQLARLALMSEAGEVRELGHRVGLGHT